MSGFKIIYDRARYPMQQKREDGTLGCRGCGSAIPKGRKTWCSNACVQRFEPAAVLHAAMQRDKEICFECGHDARSARIAWQHLRAKIAWDEWRKLEPAAIEYDHIIPFSEGGLTVLENIRSLCSACHKKRTARWHWEKSQKRQNQEILL